MLNNQSNSLPLDGITVISLEHAVAAPIATRHLADMGARVIKVERSGIGDFARSYDKRVDGLSSYFVWANRSKESICLNLKDETAIEILNKLLSTADVLVQNFAPGATKRLGLSYDDLSDKYPKLIVCDISGYGEDGPYTNKKAYDLLIQSEAGFLSITGSENEMVKAGISIADTAAGMYAYSNILGALIERSKTGRGRRIEISMLEAMVEWMGSAMYYGYKGSAPPKRNGASHATIYPYGEFSVGEGDTIIFAVQSEREWEIFCNSVIRLPELNNDQRFNDNSARVENREVLKMLIETSFKSFTFDQLIVLLDQQGIANAKVNSIEDIWQHPQLNARNRWIEIDTPQGKVKALHPPGFSHKRPAKMSAIPHLGENTKRILEELGYSDQLSKLIEQGSVA